MAGIGFELKKLFHKKSAVGYLRACSYTAIVTIGPFILMLLMILFIQAMLRSMNNSYQVEQLFLASVIYPLIFSQIASSGFAMLITRFVADKIYRKEYESVVPSLYGIITLVLLVASIPAIWFLWDAPLNIMLKLATYILYMELNIIWIQGVYLSALKDYRKIIQSYAVGVTAAVVLAYLVTKVLIPDVVTGLLVAIDIGMFLVMTMLLLNIISFFTEVNNCHFSFLQYFEKYRSLFFINICYYLGLYCPIFFIWHSPLGLMVADTYLLAPAYDVATFYAFLSLVPIAIVFVISTELNFYDKYAIYFKLITGKGNYREIEDAKQAMLQVLWSEIRNLMEIQLVVTFIFLALGNYLLPWLGLTYDSVHIYNLLLIGAYLTGMTQYFLIIMLYFEDRRGALGIAGFFLAANIVFNYISVCLGENTYGFGLFLAAFLTLSLAMMRLIYYTNRIDYFVFCTQPVLNKIEEGMISRWLSRWYPVQQDKYK